MNRDESVIARQLVDELIREHPLPESEGHPCPYLPGQVARSEGFQIEVMDPGIYSAFMDRGFRRSGQVIYRPTCPTCRACVPIRVPVREFSRSRSMKRVWIRNSDLRVELGHPEATDEKHEMYARYLASEHDGTMCGSREEFMDFLYDSPVDTIEFRYRLGRRLIGVSLADRCPGLLSSVYMYYDPKFRRRSLGTYSVLWEIQHAADCGLAYYYLGYTVAGCSKMSYKSNFRPHEVLMPNGTWKREQDVHDEPDEQDEQDEQESADHAASD
jgi:arginine-tRNA-protein transferase